MLPGLAHSLSGLELFLLLAMGHFVGDFALQSDRMAVEKCQGRDHTLPWHWGSPPTPASTASLWPCSPESCGSVWPNGCCMP